MNISEKTGILKIYVGDNDKVKGNHLSEEIVFEARKAGMSGATVFKGVMSFGASHSIHTMKIFALSSDMPVLIEIIDNIEKLDKFAKRINELMEHSKRGGLITFQELNVIRYEKGERFKK